ncbi:hypothetical protein DAI22_11g210000 [Oryza sativa Japonica Group]|nr:hypothetical protein DAI22_11g210000 [Oryza sativa Japonica Group]
MEIAITSVDDDNQVRFLSSGFASQRSCQALPIKARRKQRRHQQQRRKGKSRRPWQAVRRKGKRRRRRRRRRS